MTNRKRIFLVLFTIFLCVGADQIAKEIVKSRLPRARPLTFAGTMLKLDYSENKGAVFSFE